MKQNMQNGTISELYADDKKSKYSCNTNDILKLAKSFHYKFIYKRDKRSKLPLLYVLMKF